MGVYYVLKYECRVVKWLLFAFMTTGFSIHAVKE
jgi:hypothetical protein